MSYSWPADRRIRERETGWLDVLIEACEEAETYHALPCNEQALFLVKSTMETPSVERARKLLAQHLRKPDVR